MQAIYEWQTYICLLTGMDIANASVYDGATALAEAAIMALNENGRKKVLVSRAVDPNYRAVLTTYCDGLDVEVDEIAVTAEGTTDLAALAKAVASKEYACVALQSPNFFGNVDTLSSDALAAVNASETVPIAVVSEAISLGALATPASWGAEIVVGEGQSFGVAMAYGGPYVGFIASTRSTAPDSGTARRQECRQPRPHRLRVDAAGARAAHSPRTRDLEHLHESSPLRTDRNDLSCAHGQDRFARRRRA